MAPSITLRLAMLLLLQIIRALSKLILCSRECVAIALLGLPCLQACLCSPNHVVRDLPDSPM